MTDTGTDDLVLFVIPCSGAKLDTPAPARDLYTGTAFRHALRAAEAEAAATARDLGRPAKVMILSALHGLIDLDEEVEPYDLKMGDPGSVCSGSLAWDLGRAGAGEVYAMLPAAYRVQLEYAADLLNERAEGEWVSVFDVYEDCPGIGYQRGAASSLLRYSDSPLGAAFLTVSTLED